MTTATDATGAIQSNDENKLQLITFALGEEEYGVDIKSVREIKAWARTTPLPEAPHFVLGVINIRGSILPIFDLRDRFGQGQTVPTNTHVIIVITLGERMIGILVDAVSDIVTLSTADLRPVPDTGQEYDSAILKGLAMVNERIVSLICPENLFGRKDMDDADEFTASQQVSANEAETAV